MKLENISYSSNNFINIHFKMKERKEIKDFSPKFVRSANLKYSISLISNPLQKIKEILKIRKKDIIFEENVIKVSFNIDDLYSEDCRIHLKEITFFFASIPKITYTINKTYDFLELQPDIEDCTASTQDNKTTISSSFQYSNTIDIKDEDNQIPIQNFKIDVQNLNKKLDPLTVFHKLKAQTENPVEKNTTKSNFDLREKLLESVWRTHRGSNPTNGSL